MPCYEFYCTKCMKSFRVILGVDVLDCRAIKCPVCGTKRTNDLVGPMTGDITRSPATALRVSECAGALPS